MLDLVVLRSVQAQPPVSSSSSGVAGSQQQGASSSDLGRLLGDSAADNGGGSLSDDEADGAGPRSPSYKELRWLARYLRARIEAIKSESDDEDAEGQDGDQAPQASGSGTREGSSYQPPSSQPAINVRTRESSARSQMSNELEERPTNSSVAYSPSSAAPETPVTRFQRPIPTGRTPRQSAPASSYTAPQGQPQTQGRVSAPSTSAFSFSMPPSPSSTFGNSNGFQSAATALTASAASQPHARRRGRASHGSSPSSGFASASSPSARGPSSGTASGNADTIIRGNTGLLSPVGEEAPSSAASALAQALVEDEMEDVREERPNGRRGALVSSGGAGRGGAMVELDGQRPKRRRKTANDKFAVSTRTGGGGGGGVGGLGIAIGGGGAGGGAGGGGLLGQGQTMGLGQAQGQSQSSASGLSQEESDSGDEGRGMI